MKRLEPMGYAAALAVLSALVLFEGQKAAALASLRPVTAKQLYAQLSNPRLKVQVVDLRPHDDDHFADAHVPGAVSLPGCAPEAAPRGAAEHAYAYVPTVLVADEVDPAVVERCRERFLGARVLEGGMAAWSAANLPEDTGTYSPPKVSATGGCL